MDADDEDMDEFGSDTVRDPNSDVRLEFDMEFPGCSLTYLVDSRAPQNRALLCRLDETKDLLTIYPLGTWARKSNFLRPKYSKLRSIELEGFGFQIHDHPETIVDELMGLPAGFVKSPQYGLGLKKEFKSIIDVLESAGTKSFVISNRVEEPRIDGDVYELPFGRYDTLRKSLNRITERFRKEASVDRGILAHNDLLSALDPAAYGEKSRPYKKDTIFKIVHETVASNAELSEGDKKSLVDVVRASSSSLAKTEPQQLLALKTDIEVATLEELIRRFEGMMAKSLSESQWQDFLQDNPFVLSLAFGYPVVILRGQASIGGTRIAGDGQKISDFLAHAKSTGNAAIIEIKKPSSVLLNKAPYRAGLYSPSAELSGAISQCLDQRWQLQRDISRIKDDSNLPGLQAYAVHCILVIGTLSAGKEEQKSFELVRNAIHGVSVITFDELLEKLQTLLALLKGSAANEEDLA